MFLKKKMLQHLWGSTCEMVRTWITNGDISLPHHMSQAMYAVQCTCKVSHNSTVMVYSSSVSSNAQRLLLWSDVISSTAFWYPTAKSNMSNVKFQHVLTSHGIHVIWMGSHRSSMHCFHISRRIIVKWIILKEKTVKLSVWYDEPDHYEVSRVGKLFHISYL